MPIYGPTTLRQRIAVAAAGLITLVGTSAGVSTAVTLKVVKTTPLLSIRAEKLLELKSSSGTGLWVDGSGSTVGSGKYISQRTTDLGWSKQSSANQACNTTCTYACVFGEDTGVIGTLLACTDATADVCICAGPN